VNNRFLVFEPGQGMDSSHRACYHFSDKVDNADVKNWSIPEVSIWLKSLNLSCYIDLFSAEHIDGATLLQLTETDLRNVMNIPLGEMKKIISAIEMIKLKGEHGEPGM